MANNAVTASLPMIVFEQMATTAMSVSIKNLKVYVPAKNFELSKRFYSALGFTTSPGFGDKASSSMLLSSRRLPEHGRPFAKPARGPPDTVRVAPESSRELP